MWKPYNCAVATNRQMLHLGIRAWSRAWKVDVKGSVTFSITIVAFLFAVEYFTAKPSLNIVILRMPYGYYMDSVLSFYEERGLDLPRLFTEDPSLAKLFTENTRPMDPNYIPLDAGTPDEEVIEAIARGQDIGWFVEYMTKQLESQIERYTFVKHIYGGGLDERGFYREEDFKPIREYVKSKSSATEYYIFLAALIRSREIGNTVFVKNDGDVDLSNIRITFPAPLSKITSSRADNLLNYRADTALLYELTVDDIKLAVHLPSLKKGEFASLDIRTRENEINSKEIFYSYEQDRLIKKRRVSVVFVIVFILSLARQMAKGDNLKAERSAVSGMADRAGVQ